MITIEENLVMTVKELQQALDQYDYNAEVKVSIFGPSGVKMPINSVMIENKGSIVVLTNKKSDRIKD